jgi:hypothetical protein
LIKHYHLLQDSKNAPVIPDTDADRATIGLVELVFQYVVSIYRLGRSSYTNQAAASACARAAFEIGAKAWWIASPDDLTERHARWLGYFQENENFWVKFGKDAQTNSKKGVADLAHAKANYYREYSAKVSEQFNNPKPVKMPDLKT